MDVLFCFIFEGRIVDEWVKEYEGYLEVGRVVSRGFWKSGFG